MTLIYLIFKVTRVIKLYEVGEGWMFSSEHSIQFPGHTHSFFT